jgi:hypothetical protein
LNLKNLDCTSNGAPAGCDSVRNELMQEIEWVENVNAYFSGLQDPLIGTQQLTSGTLGLFQKNITDALKPKPSSVAKWVAFATSLAGDLTGLGGVLEGKIAKALVVTTQALATASTISSVSGDSGDPITGEAQVQITQLDLTLAQNAHETYSSLDRIREIVVADYGKLSKVGPKTAPGADWVLSDDDYNTAVDQIQVGVVRQAYQAVLPAVGNVFQLWPYLNFPANYDNVTDAGKLWCQDVDEPLTNNPPSSQPKMYLWPSTYWDNSLDSAKNRPAWLMLVYRLVSSHYRGEPPRASVTDPLARPPAPSGIFPPGPTTLPNPGFYTPWLFLHGFESTVFDC